jgi:formate dehydrogenase alpha subunit
VAGLAAAFGNGAMTNSIAEIADAKCLFVIGSNTTEAHPLIAHRIFEAKKNGTKLIVVDPRRIQLSLVADLHIRPNFGTDVALLNGIMHEIVAKGYHDQKFIEERTEGFAELKTTLQKYSPEIASKICGVPVDVIREAAEIYATSEPSAILYTLGITEHSHGVDNVKTLANLAMLTGQIGKQSSGVNPLRGQNNVQGACDMGALPNVYPGYQVVTNSGSREKFQNAWGKELSDEIGLTIPEMIDGLIEGSMKGMYIVGEDTAVSDPDTHHITHALESAEFLVVQDLFLTKTAEFADVVLPAACWAEKDGTFTSSERKVQRVRQAVNPPGEAKADWQILSEIGRRLGLSMEYSSSIEIFREIAELSPIYGGITYDRIEQQDLQWPCPTPDHQGTQYLHQGKFGRGLGLFSAIEFRPSEELPDADYPFFLTTGRRFAHYNARSMTGRCPSLHTEYAEAVTQMHQSDAEKIGLRDGDSIRVVSRRGEVTSKVRAGDIVPEGAIFMDFHFAESNSNVLLGTSLDPITKTPDYKVCAVRVEKLP